MIPQECAASSGFFCRPTNGENFRMKRSPEYTQLSMNWFDKGLVLGKRKAIAMLKHDSFQNQWKLNTYDVANLQQKSHSNNIKSALAKSERQTVGIDGSESVSERCGGCRKTVHSVRRSELQFHAVWFPICWIGVGKRPALDLFRSVNARRCFRA